MKTKSASDLLSSISKLQKGIEQKEKLSSSDERAATRLVNRVYPIAERLSEEGQRELLEEVYDKMSRLLITGAEKSDSPRFKENSQLIANVFKDRARLESVAKDLRPDSKPPLLEPELKIQKCPECGSSRLIHDYDTGETTCGSCGLVRREQMTDKGPELRAFDAEQRAKRTRAGVPRAYIVHDKGLSTITGRDTHGKELTIKQRLQIYRLRKWELLRDSLTEVHPPLRGRALEKLLSSYFSEKGIHAEAQYSMHIRIGSKRFDKRVDFALFDKTGNVRAIIETKYHLTRDSALNLSLYLEKFKEDHPRIARYILFYKGDPKAVEIVKSLVDGVYSVDELESFREDITAQLRVT